MTRKIQPQELTLHCPELSREQAALYMGVSLRTIDRLREAGEIDWFYVGSCVRIDLESIEAYKERQRQARRARQRASSRLWQSKTELDISIPFIEEQRQRRAA